MESQLKYEAGLDEMKGHRDKMEDVSIIVPFSVQNNHLPNFKSCLFTGVFDGHSGKFTATYISTALIKYLREELETQSSEDNIPTVLRNVFMKIDQELFDEWRNNGESCRYDSGSTAIVAIITLNRIYIANCGDCRCVVATENAVVFSTIDHKANLESERERIYNAGSHVVSYGGPPRVGGALAVSRAFGDFFFKRKSELPLKDQAVTAFPDIAILPLRPNKDSKHLFDTETEDPVKYVILGCDGVWDSVSNEMVFKIVNDARSTEKSAREAASLVVGKAFAFGSQDNISCIVVYLQ